MVVPGKGGTPLSDPSPPPPLLKGGAPFREARPPADLGAVSLVSNDFFSDSVLQNTTWKT